MMTKTETRKAAKSFIAHNAWYVLEALADQGYIHEDIALDSADGQAIKAEAVAIIEKLLQQSR